MGVQVPLRVPKFMKIAFTYTDKDGEHFVSRDWSAVPQVGDFVMLRLHGHPQHEVKFQVTEILWEESGIPTCKLES